MLLLGGSLLALGSFISSLTENQLIAAVLTFAAFLMVWVIDLGTQGAKASAGTVLQYLSVIRHYDDFTRGIIDTSGLIYYAELHCSCSFSRPCARSIRCAGGGHSCHSRLARIKGDS